MMLGDDANIPADGSEEGQTMDQFLAEAFGHEGELEVSDSKYNAKTMNNLQFDDQQKNPMHH